MQVNNEILIDYLDHHLGDTERKEVENILQNDKSLTADFQYLKLAVDVIRLDAIESQVSKVRRSLEDRNIAINKPATIIVHRIYKTSLRVAAIFIILLGITVLYKYLSVTDLSIYQKQFRSYELNNLRGHELYDAEVIAYQNRNWNEVLSIYDSKNDKSNKSVFLAAMSQMQLSHFQKAIVLFEYILTSNADKEDNSFQEESEYYLSLAYLMNHQVSQSLLLMVKIKSDPSHIYYPLVSKLSAVDLKILELKK